MKHIYIIFLCIMYIYVYYVFWIHKCLIKAKNVVYAVLKDNILMSNYEIGTFRRAEVHPIVKSMSIN